MIRDGKRGRDTAKDPFHKSHSAHSLRQMTSVEELQAPTMKTVVGSIENYFILKCIAFTDTEGKQDMSKHD